jgi:hypothetical protein
VELLSVSDVSLNTFGVEFTAWSVVPRLSCEMATAGSVGLKLPLTKALPTAQACRPEPL